MKKNKFENQQKEWPVLLNEFISEEEMMKTFNCGVGFSIIVNPKNLSKISKYFSKDYKPYVIGEISKNSKKIKLNGEINLS